MTSGPRIFDARHEGKPRDLCATGCMESCTLSAGCTLHWTTRRASLDIVRPNQVAAA